MSTRNKKIAPNKARNEFDVKLGDNTYICKMSFATITELEDYFDKSIFEIYQLFESGKFRVKQIADVIDITSTTDIDREQLESDLESVGALIAIASLTELLSTAFVGNTKKPTEVTDNDTKSQ